MKKGLSGKSNDSSAFAGCFDRTPEIGSGPTRPAIATKKAEVTGKITGVREAKPEPALEPTREDYEEEEVDQAYRLKAQASKEYRDILEAQVEAKQMARMMERERVPVGVGLQLGSMSESEMIKFGKRAGIPEESHSAAKEVQMYNQQLAQMKAVEKERSKDMSRYTSEADTIPKKSITEPISVLEEEAERDRVLTSKAQKSAQLKKDLEAQIQYNKMKKLNDKMERMGYQA